MISEFFTGLSSTGQIWLSLTPSIAIFLFFLCAYVVYRIKYHHCDYPVFREVEARPASKMLSRHFRCFLFWCINPTERFLINHRIDPNWITLTSAVLAAISGLMMAFGQFALGGWVYIFAGLCDVLDGRVARRTGQVTSAGGVLDSILDRYAEFFVFAGLAWFYSDTWVLLVVVAAQFGSVMVSYVRAKSESIGIRCAVGRFQRAERLVYLGVGLALSPIATALFAPANAPTHWLAVVVIVFIAIGANGTALRRLIFVFQEAVKSSRSESVERSTVRLSLAKKH